jgi:hypothetical protein
MFCRFGVWYSYIKALRSSLMFVENFGKHQTGQAIQREVAHTKILNKRLLTTPTV